MTDESAIMLATEMNRLAVALERIPVNSNGLLSGITVFHYGQGLGLLAQQGQYGLASYTQQGNNQAAQSWPPKAT